MKRAFRVTLLSLLALGLMAVAGPLEGTNALQAGHSQTRGFLNVTMVAGDPLEQHLDLWMTPASGGGAIRQYTVEMTKRLHMIIVSDDFEHFLHIHPTLGADGHFSIDARFPTPALYHIYADAEPAGIGQQVFRFDVPIAGGRAASARSLAPTGRSVAAGPYIVTLSATTVSAGRETDVTVHVLHDGQPARDLHPYLGALAHAVFLNARDLTYVHVHPAPLGAAGASAMGGMNMGDMTGMGGMDMTPLPDTASSSPDMLLRVMLREPGTSKLWLQFRGGTELYVAAFVITAE